jgi:hypothetical protein
MISFETISESQKFMESQIDIPIADCKVSQGGMNLHTYSYDFEEDRFTNIYDLSFLLQDVTPKFQVYNRLTSIYDHMHKDLDSQAAIVGGFFFLADKYTHSPRQLALNMAIVDSTVHSLPIIDREAIIINEGRLSYQHIKAMGMLP